MTHSRRIKMAKDAKPAAAAAAGAKKGAKKGQSAAKIRSHSLKFQARPKQYRVGMDVLPKSDMSRFVKWPRYIRLQRQKKVLQERLKVPPALNLLQTPVPKNQGKELMALLNKYKPESPKEKAARLKAKAAALAAGQKYDAGPKPVSLKMGLKHVTGLVESKKAKLVVIAADVDPVELVVWLPALCRKFEVPHMIVRNQGLLGQLVHKKRATCLALTAVHKEDEAKLKAVQEAARSIFENKDTIKKWGGGVLSTKTRLRIAVQEAAIEAERAKKAKAMGQ